VTRPGRPREVLTHVERIAAHIGVAAVFPGLAENVAAVPDVMAHGHELPRAWEAPSDGSERG
jgi:hypothetical protein